MKSDSPEIPTRREPADARKASAPFSSPEEQGAEGPTSDEIMAGQYAGSVLNRSLELLIPDDEMERNLQQVKLDAMSRTMREEPNPDKSNLRSAVLPLTWAAASGTVSPERDSGRESVREYVLTYHPFGPVQADGTFTAGRFSHKRLARKQLASFWVGGMVGGLVPAGVLLFSGTVDRYEKVWTVAFLTSSIIAAIGVLILGFFTYRTIRATSSIDIRVGSEETQVVLKATRRIVGRPTAVFPYGTPSPARPAVSSVPDQSVGDIARNGGYT